MRYCVNFDCAAICSAVFLFPAMTVINTPANVNIPDIKAIVISVGAITNPQYRLYLTAGQTGQSFTSISGGSQVVDMTYSGTTTDKQYIELDIFPQSNLGYLVPGAYMNVGLEYKNNTDFYFVGVTVTYYTG